MAMATVHILRKRLGRDRPWAIGLALICVFSLFSAASSAAPKRLSLSEAVQRARANPLVRAASEQRRAAEARLAEARGARFPRAEVISFIAPSPDITCLDQNCTRTDPRDPKLAADGVFGSWSGQEAVAARCCRLGGGSGGEGPGAVLAGGPQ